MDVNRLLRHLFEKGEAREIGAALREKMTIMSREDAVI